MAMKRPNNSGSVYKLPGKRRRPYAVRVFDGVELKEDGNAKLKYKYLGYFEKQTDALQFLEKYNASPTTLAKPTIPKNKHYFSEIYEMYMDELKSQKDLSTGSYYSRKAAYENLKPLHRMVFETLTLEDLESAANKHSDLSASSMTMIKIILKGMYKTAMRHKFVTDDLSALLLLKHSGHTADVHEPFTDDEINVLWQHKDGLYPKLCLILIYTGMRVNELLNMKSEDVFLDKKYMVGGLKTKAGKNRSIPLSEKIIPLLDVSNEYLISVNGKKLSYGIARTELKQALNEIGLDHKFHDARHTCATLLEKHNISILHRKLILGHATADITDRYTHVSIQDLINDINKL